jgi:pimeloyl-ACP methyl ester carboxylesterase
MNSPGSSADTGESSSTEQRHRLSVAGAVLTYWFRRCGRADAPTLLLLHGAASNHTRWSEFLSLSPLTRRCDSLRPDLRGNGASMWRGHIDQSVWASDLRAILAHERIPEVILVGHSLGAQVALRFANQAPSATTALILVDPIVPDALVGGRLVLARLRPLLQPAIALLRLLARLGFRRRTFPDLDLRELDRQTRLELTRSEHPGQLARKYGSLQQILRYLPVATYLDELAASVEPLPPLEALEVPVLTLLATGTTIADAPRIRREIDRFPDGTIIPIPADHWPLTEAPREVCHAIESWLEERRLVPQA